MTFTALYDVSERVLKAYFGQCTAYQEMMLKTSTMLPYTMYHSFHARSYTVSGMNS